MFYGLLAIYSRQNQIKLTFNRINADNYGIHSEQYVEVVWDLRKESDTRRDVQAFGEGRNGPRRTVSGRSARYLTGREAALTQRHRLG